MPIANLLFTGIADDTGASPTDRATSDNTLTLSGTFTRIPGSPQTLRVWILGPDNVPVLVTTTRDNEAATQPGRPENDKVWVGSVTLPAEGTYTVW